jgi:hypothetical protein
MPCFYKCNRVSFHRTVYSCPQISAFRESDTILQRLPSSDYELFCHNYIDSLYRIVPDALINVQLNFQAS